LGPAPHAMPPLRPRSRWPVEPAPPPPPQMPAQMPKWGLYALRLAAVTAFAAATAFAALVPFVLAHLGLAQGIDDEMTSVGFDAERVQLIVFALLVLAGGVGAGIVLRWRSPVWLGGVLYYTFGYLLPYISQAQHPTQAPDGTPRVLVRGAFAITLATLLAVGVVFSGAGAVLGEACGRVFAIPLITLGRFVVARTGRHGSPRAAPREVWTTIAALGLSAIIVIALLLVASNLDTILNYGTVATIYQPVQVAALQGTIAQGTYPSPALGGRWRPYMIYLPPSYSAFPQRRYPVVYMLHGNPGSMTDWFAGAHLDTIANDLITAGKIRETIFVAPDGNGPDYRVSEWANSFDNRQRLEDSIVYDLVHEVDTHYRTLADSADRAIAGNSDGGFAAANIALHHPDVFDTVLSLGGYFVADNGPVFGVGPASTAYRRTNSPAMYVTTPSGLQAARALTFFIGVGTQDRPYFPLGIAFYGELRQLGVRADLLRVPGGHSWQVWAPQAAYALPIMEPPVAQGSSPDRSLNRSLNRSLK
jgi:enterochelin esterase-like enzyme